MAVTIVRVLITLLCGVGLYVSLFMLRKSIRAGRGEIPGPSVVKSEQAHVIFGLPNSLIGTVYYPAMAVAVWFDWNRVGAIAAALVVLGAAATSLYLAFSLLYITRRWCPYCWTAHTINWLLVFLCGWLIGVRLLSAILFLG